MIGIYGEYFKDLDEAVKRAEWQEKWHDGNKFEILIFDDCYLVVSEKQLREIMAKNSGLKMTEAGCG